MAQQEKQICRDMLIEMGQIFKVGDFHDYGNKQTCMAKMARISQFGKLPDVFVDI